MMNLAEYRRHSQSLADFLPWAALVGKGVILNKDGSFQRTVRFRGPDLDSATPAELVAITGRLNWDRAGRSSSRRNASLPTTIRGTSLLMPPPVLWTPNVARSSRKKARISRAATS
jgi:hypothetical protein